MSTSKVYQFEQYELDMLKESEEDLKYGRVISQEDLDKEDLEFLSTLNQQTRLILNIIFSQ